MIDFETKRQKVLAYIKGLKTMPVVVAKEPAPEPVATIDGVAYYHKQEFDLETLMTENVGSVVRLSLLGDASEPEDVSCLKILTYGPPIEYGGSTEVKLILGKDTSVYPEVNYYNTVATLAQGSVVPVLDYTSKAFIITDSANKILDSNYIYLPTCSAYYGFLSEDGKTFISYYNLKTDGAPTETIMVPVYDQNGVDPEKLEALKAVAAGGKVGEELLDEIVDFIDNPPVPPLPDDKIHAYLTVPSDSLTATFDCGTLIDGAAAKVDWGDGTIEDLTANTRMTHTYAAAGDYEVKISGMAAFKTGYYPGHTVFFKEHLREVVLSNLMDIISAYVFANCTGLTSVTIPSNVVGIASFAFYGCSGLASIIVDPDNQMYYSEGNCLITTGDNVLILGCKTSVIPDSVTSIGQGAFSNCTGLTSITIPNGVTSIGESAFNGCTGLTSITIPNGVTSIGPNAFNGCTGLTSITIPNGVTSIGDQTFYSCSSLMSIIIPDSVISIGQWAFNGCTGLTSITIPNGVTSIGPSAFNGCTGLTSITIPNGVTSIDGQTFYNCSSLEEVIFEDGRESVPTLVDGNAFTNLPADYKIYVQRDLLSAWKAAEQWSSIADHIEGLPWTDGHIHGVFSMTGGNQQVSFKPGTFIENVEHKIDWGDGTIEDLAAAGTSMSHTYATAGDYDFTIKGTSGFSDDAFKNCRYLTSVTIPNSFTSIGNNAFNACNKLTSIDIPNSVTSIGNGAFQACSRLASITIPNSVTSIGGNAFRGCTGLTSITIPNSVTSIDNFVFEECTGLMSLTIGSGVASIGQNVFTNCRSLTSINVEQNNQTYRSEGNCLIKTSNNTLILGCKTSVIPNSVISIGGYAFDGCTGLTSITIPNSVTAIGAGAFQNCTGLTSITIPDNVTSIGGNAFTYCSGLTSITIPGSVSTISSEAFNGCTGLTSVTISSGVSAIWYNAFQNCTGLTSITIPNSVTEIMGSAFRGCSSLSEVIFEDNRESVPTLDNTNAFTDNASGRKFYVQSDLLDAWKAASNWATYAADIEALPAA